MREEVLGQCTVQCTVQHEDPWAHSCTFLNPDSKSGPGSPPQRPEPPLFLIPFILSVKKASLIQYPLMPEVTKHALILVFNDNITKAKRWDWQPPWNSLCACLSPYLFMFLSFYRFFPCLFLDVCQLAHFYCSLSVFLSFSFSIQCLTTFSTLLSLSSNRTIIQ